MSSQITPIWYSSVLTSYYLSSRPKRTLHLLEPKVYFVVRRSGPLNPNEPVPLQEALHFKTYSSIIFQPTPTYPRCCSSLRFTDWNCLFFSRTNTNVHLHTCLMLPILHLRNHYCIHKSPSFNTIYPVKQFNYADISLRFIWNLFFHLCLVLIREFLFFLLFFMRATCPAGFSFSSWPQSLCQLW